MNRVVPAAALLLLLAGCGGRPAGLVTGAGASSSAGLRGTLPPRPYVLPALHLTDQHGKPYALHPGRDTLVFFGYTHCPDECPTTMADAAQALRDAPQQAARTTVVFVSSDPHRDTPAQLDRWLSAFAWPTSTAVVGLTGPFPAVRKAARQLDVPLDPPVVTAGDYQVTHGSQLIGFDAHGRAQALWLTGTPPADIAHDLALLDNPPPPPPSPAASFFPAVTAGGLQVGQDRAFAHGTGAVVELTVRSQGPADRLTGAVSTTGSTVTGASGAVPAHGDLHVRLDVRGLGRPVASGDVVRLVLQFAGQGPVPLQVPVTGATPAPTTAS